MNEDIDNDADFDELLDQAKLPERKLPVCLCSDLVEEYQDLKRQHVEQTEGSLAGGGTNEELEHLEAQIRKATKTFVFRSLPRKKYRKLMAEYRSQSPDDRAAGTDMEPFMAALLRECTVSPKMNETRWERLEASLSTGQWEEIHAAVHAVNATRAKIPFS